MFQLAQSACILALTADLLVAATPTSRASAPDTETISIKTSASTVVLGTKVTVSGSGPSLRTVILQMDTAENGWQNLAQAVTGLAGDYSFTAPSWYGAHRLRVVVPGTVIFNPHVSVVKTVTVKTGYRPRGASSDWAWLGHKGSRWDPCRRITYRVNAAGGYEGAMADIKAAINRVVRITGFALTFVGTTTNTVVRGRRGYHPAGTDIVLDWQSPGQDPGLSGGVAGIGGHWVLDKRRFDGYVVLDRTARLARRTWRQVMEHEVGHVLGLGHADAPSQVMYGTASGKNTRFGAGDLAGLSRVGASRGCLPSGPHPRGSEPERNDSALVPK